jgi:hypothetical protein
MKRRVEADASASALRSAVSPERLLKRRRRLQIPAQGCARSGLPWVLSKPSFATLKGLPIDVISSARANSLPQGVALGWNLQTPSALIRETIYL